MTQGPRSASTTPGDGAAPVEAGHGEATRGVAARGGAMAPAVSSPASWLRFLVGFLALWGLLAASSAADTTGRWRVAILAATVVGAAVVEKVLYGTSATHALRLLGLGRPAARALVLAAAVSALVLLVFPLSAVVTGAPARLRPDWAWWLLGTFAFNGVAEELVWRGFTFRRLRDGRPFRAAVGWTMPLIAVTHVPIMLTSGPVVGVGAMLVAAVTSIPFSYLYEVGGSTVWAPAVVHTAIDSFKLFLIPAAAVTTFSLLLIAVSLVVPLLALAVPRRVLAPAHADAADVPTAT